METSTKSEVDRLENLRSYDILDTPSEESFESIARLAKMIFQAPVALVSFVDKDRQWLKAKQGLTVCETPRDISFCTHTIRCNEPLIIRDSTKDPRFLNSPLVVDEPHIRFYAGAPLRTPTGFNIGSLCVIDYIPREPSAEQIDLLQALAKLVVNQLELRQLATTDSLTGLLTRRALLSQAKREFKRLHRYKRAFSVIAFDLDHFKKVNDNHGHPTGDRVIEEVTAACKKHLREQDIFGRMGGEEFCVFLPETNSKAALFVAERMRRTVEAIRIVTNEEHLKITASFGVSEAQERDHSLNDVINRADEALYAAKSKGRNCCVKNHATEFLTQPKRQRGMC
jgi:diguanylate cyclase (GGDEF)-like protein